VAADEPTAEAESPRSARTSKLWSDVRIDPVEIALPGGVGYTLRAYRPSSEIAMPGASTATVELDDFDAAAAAVARRRRATDEEEEALPGGELEDELDEEFEDELLEELDEETEDEKLDDELDDEELDEDEEEDDEEDESEDEEIPVFLGRNGRLYLFHSPEKLVEFVRSGAENNLDQVDTWSDLVKRIGTDDVVPLAEDSYELDLVVENLRGGPDAWEPSLILKAGEVARDLGYALRIDPVLVALASGSPLDDLDEALRAAEAGGVGSFFAKRRLRKIPAQQSSLGWRTIIGKISAIAEWRD
jgi:DNA-directed RNA polymerase delta subunit